MLRALLRRRSVASLATALDALETREASGEGATLCPLRRQRRRPAREHDGTESRQVPSGAAESTPALPPDTSSASSP